MHDIKFIRKNPELFDKGLKRRGLEGMSKTIIDIDQNRRKAIASSEELRAKQNKLSKQAGHAKAKGKGDTFIQLRKEVADCKTKEQEFNTSISQNNESLRNILLALPNLPFDDVPDGSDENSNLELKYWGDPKEFTFNPVEHFVVPSVQKLFDFSNAAKISGSRFVILKGCIARLHRALSQFMIDVHINEHNLSEVWAPVLVNSEMMEGTGHLPKFAEDSYQTDNQKWLVPTSEVSLTNLVHGQIVNERDLPFRWCAHSQCFRSEAGSAGKDTTGMLRQHQFEKVEMVSITTPEESNKEQSKMLQCAENIVQKLELPYRVVSLCTGDLGFAARKTYDVEVWLPGQNKYREISSVSNCGDFQARRMNARLRRHANDSIEFVHTLNGSGLAVGRTLIAIIENGQNEDGSVTLPNSLSPYLGGFAAISPSGQFV